MKNQLNVIGSRMRFLRERKQLTQEELTVKCQVLGLDITRGTLAKIESEIRAVFDHEIPFLARSLSVKMEELFLKKLKALPRKLRNSTGTKGKRRM